MTRKMTRAKQCERLGEFLLTGRKIPKPMRIKPVKKSNQRETGKGGVCDDCMKYLKSLELYYPCKVERINTGAGYSRDGRFMQYGKSGRADIYFTLSGRIYYIECKSGSGGYLSAEQIKFKINTVAAGATFWVVCSKSELKNSLTDILATTPKLPGTFDPDNDPELQEAK